MWKKKHITKRTMSRVEIQSVSEKLSFLHFVVDYKKLPTQHSRI